MNCKLNTGNTMAILISLIAFTAAATFNTLTPEDVVARSRNEFHSPPKKRAVNSHSKLLSYSDASAAFGVYQPDDTFADTNVQKRATVHVKNPAFALQLVTKTIDTFETAAQLVESPENASPLTTSPAMPVNEMTKRLVLPYLVQCKKRLTPAFHTHVENSGAKIIGYIPNNALLIEATPDTLYEIAASQSDVQWMGEYLPAYKISPAIDDLSWGILKTNVHDISLTLFSVEDIPAVIEAVYDIGGTIEKEDNNATSFTATLTRDQCDLIVKNAAIKWIEPAARYVLHNNVAVHRELTNVRDAWEVHGLSGKGEIIAHCDTGLSTGNASTLHPDFTNRLVRTYALSRSTWSDNVGHGTHTAGTLLGNGSAYSNGMYRGVAYEAELVHQSVADSNGILDGIPSNLNTLFTPPYNDGARIHSDSWGSEMSMSRYTADSRAVDEFMWNHKDMLIVLSAGNSSADFDFDGVSGGSRINPPSTAKNCLTVGASESIRPPGSGGFSSRIYGSGNFEPYFPLDPIHDDYFSSSYDGFHHGMFALSSRGPCADGRIKPDVVAPGTDIISCRAAGISDSYYWGNVNSRYAFLGGTSMATPLVAGSAGLIRQFLREQASAIISNPSAALVKAMLVNGAASLTPGQYGYEFGREISASHPNAVEGWGHINVGASVTNVTVYDAAGITTDETNSYTYIIAASNSLAVTLAWTDYPSEESAALNLVNDLDLSLVLPDGTIVFPNNTSMPDRTNNVEDINIAVIAPGTCTVTIVAHNVPYGPQPYGLVVRGANPVVPTHGFDMYMQSPRTNAVRPDTDVLISAWVNTNYSGIADVTLCYRTNASWITVAMAPAGGFDTGVKYTNSIPHFPTGTSVEYYLEAIANDSATDTSVSQSYTVHDCIVYVATDGSQTPPYDTWATACTNLQKAINYADDGWQILVTNGIYYNMERATTYWGVIYIPEVLVNKSVEILSVNGPLETILDNRYIFRVLTVIQRGAVIDGFTIQRAYTFDIGGLGGMSGGGVYVIDGILRNCIIQDNIVAAAGSSGGGASFDHNGMADACVFKGNIAYGGFVGYGGGAYLYEGGLLRSCNFYNNLANAAGGGVNMRFGTMSNCTVTANQADRYPESSGVSVYHDGEIVNSIIYGNHNGNLNYHNSGWDIPPSYRFSYNCVSPVPSGTGVSGTGNFADDPQFASSAGYDYHLSDASPCRDAGITSEWMYSACDADGNPRVSGTSVDCGAFEYGPFMISFTASPTRGFTLPLTVNFTTVASGNNTTNISYFWDFNKNGSNDISGTAYANPSHDYNEGIYSVRLAATNTAGETAYWERNSYIYAYASNIIFISKDGTHSPPFTSWKNAATNIYDAINWSLDNCTVIVSNGHYLLPYEVRVNKDIDFKSYTGAQNTILDGQGNTRCLYISANGALIDGFTVTNGLNSYGGGIYFAAQATVQNCFIRNNQGSQGSAVYLYRPGTVKKCEITHNYGATYGTIFADNGASVLNCKITDNDAYLQSAIDARDGALVRNCLIARNHSDYISIVGGYQNSGYTVENCTIVDNTIDRPSSSSGKCGAIDADSGTFRNNIVRFNTHNGIESNFTGAAEHNYSNIHPLPATGTGNINSDPGFVNRTGGNYELSTSSYSVNAGHNETWQLGYTDLAGNPRRINGKVDIGAYELNTNIPLIRVSAFLCDMGILVPDETTNTTLTVWNAGGATLTGYAEQPEYPFALTDATNYSLSINASTVLDISFSPTNQGTFQRTFTCYGGGDALITLQGESIPEPGIIAVSIFLLTSLFLRKD